MKPEHEDQLSIWINEAVDKKPNLFREYEKQSFLFSKYIWDLIHGLNQARWIKAVLYTYLDDGQIEAAVVRILEVRGIHA